MAFIETHPNLCKQYPVLTLLGDSLAAHFCHWFNLDELESVFSTPSSIEQFKKGSYGIFFDACMKHISDKDCQTEDELVPTLSQFLNAKETIDQHIWGHYLLKPNDPNQLGFLEKLATSEHLALDEPITEMDLNRIIRSYETDRKNKTNQTIKVLQSNYLAAPYCPLTDLDCDACVINLNTDLSEPAKWGVLKKGEPNEFYCEMSITDSEKQLLELRFGTIKYQGQTANNLRSTGYSAVAWLDQEVMKVHHSRVEFDFATQIHQFIFAQFQGDNPGKLYSFTNGEDQKTTQGFRHALSDKASEPPYRGGMAVLLVQTIFPPY